MSRKMPKLYKTSQINLEPGEQLRITAGTRTVFVLRNGSGLHVNKGGYARKLPAPPAASEDRP